MENKPGRGTVWERTWEVETNSVLGQPCELWDNFALSMEVRSEGWGKKSNFNAHYRKPECHQKDLNFVVNREPLEVWWQRADALDPNVGKSLFFLDPLLIPLSGDTVITAEAIAAKVARVPYPAMKPSRVDKSFPPSLLPSLRAWRGKGDPCSLSSGHSNWEPSSSRASGTTGRRKEEGEQEEGGWISNPWKSGKDRVRRMWDVFRAWTWNSFLHKVM